MLFLPADPALEEWSSFPKTTEMKKKEAYIASIRQGVGLFFPSTNKSLINHVKIIVKLICSRQEDEF